MRWLVLGAGGMLGQDVVATLRERGHDVTALDRDEADITDEAAVTRAAAGHDVVMNCAAWTAVDDAESHEAAAFTVNAIGAAMVARAAATAGARVVHVSTDYVFAGDATAPYTEAQAPAPRSAYGRTKLAGEWGVAAYAPEHLVLRVAWLYGAHGPCFPRTIVGLLRERGTLDVVADQLGQPTWTRDVADLALRLVEAQAPSGTYHATSSGETSWLEFARAAVAAAGLDPQAVHPTTSAQFARPAPRPAFSVLAHDALERVGVTPIGDWRARWDEAAGVVLGDEAR